MLQGMATSNIQANDLAAARDWYTDLFGIEPYFIRDGYLEWRLGRDQDEFGIIDAKFVPGSADRRPGGQFVYWSVDDVQTSFDELLTRGGTPYEPVTTRSEGWVTAAVVDPFGNVLGIMRNPHWRGEE